MSKFRHPASRLFLLLACNLALASTLAQESLYPTATLTTVASRKQALSDLIAQRNAIDYPQNKIGFVRLTNSISDIYLLLRDFESALLEAKKSSRAARGIEGPEGGELLVDATILSGRAYIHLSDYHTSLRILNNALELSRTLGYRRGEAQSLTLLGVAYFHLAEVSKSEISHDQALKIWHDLKDKHGEAQTLMTQGVNLILQDKAAEATTALEKAETIWRDQGNSVELATALVNLNFLAIRQGQWQAALSRLSQAQNLLVDKEAEPYLAGQIAMSFGEAYEVYGQLETALSYFEEALFHYRDGARDKSATVDAGNKAARVRARLGDYSGAKEQIERGLLVAAKIDSDLIVGLCHEDLGRVWLEEGKYEEARREFRTAIEYFERIRNRRPWARAQSFLGQTEYLLGNTEAAAGSYLKALRFFKEVPDYTNEAAVCFGMGKLELDRDQLHVAGEYLKRSIDLTEQLRENAASRELRSSFLGSVHDRYETYVEWLMAQHLKQPGLGLDVKAFEAAESGRARSLLDSLRDHQRELRQVADPALLAKEGELLKQEQQLLDERAKLLSAGGTSDELATLENDLTKVRAQNETLQAQLNSSLQFTNLVRPAPLSYSTIQKHLTDAETSVLEFSLGRRKSFAWLLTRDGLTNYELENKRTIEDAARQLVVLLKNPVTSDQKNELSTAIDRVSKLVLSQVASHLRGSRLVIVADGILQYVPFQILTTGGEEPLISRFEIVYTPSASALAVRAQQDLNRPTGHKLLVGFGDPVVPPRHTRLGSKAQETHAGNNKPVVRAAKEDKRALGESDLPYLFYARRELRAIGVLAGENQSSLYLKHDATRQNLRNLDLSQFRILHLATHGVLDSSHPELSGLIFSTVNAEGQPLDGFVGLADIYKLRAPVSLVVLSACDTALGRDMRGEGLVGVTRGFMYAGASSVVASLWKVEDEATSEIMKLFYANMLQRGMPPAAALRAAQNSIREQPQWSSPYYWASFTFQGDYNQIIKAAPTQAVPENQRLIVVAALGVALAALAWWLFRRVIEAKSYSTTKK